VEDKTMKKIILFSVIALAVTAGGAFAQMGGGQHMMGAAQQPQAQTPSRQGVQPYYGMMGYGTYPGMMGGYGMQQPVMGYGMGPMYPGMMGYGTASGMMGGYGMQQPMMGYGMYPGMMGGNGMQQPMMGLGTGYGMQPGMMSGGMPHMYPGAGGNVDQQREFLKETSQLRKKLHDLMFDYMEAQWNPETKPEQLEKLGSETQKLQQELHEKSREALK
jgi:hypothetical protein